LTHDYTGDENELKKDRALLLDEGKIIYQSLELGILIYYSLEVLYRFVGLNIYLGNGCRKYRCEIMFRHGVSKLLSVEPDVSNFKTLVIFE